MTAKTVEYGEVYSITDGEFAIRRGGVAVDAAKALATAEQASRRIELRREGFWRRRAPASIEPLNRRFQKRS